MHTFLLRVLSCAFAFSCAGTHGLIVTTESDPDAIEISFTIRSFLGATCAPTAQMTQYWPVRPKPKGAGVLGTLPNTCPYADLRAKDELRGHPDFQIGMAEFTDTYENCTCAWYPRGGTPAFLNKYQSPPVNNQGNPVDTKKAITKIVKDVLEFDAKTGLGKPRYCSDNPNDKCGVPLSNVKEEWKSLACWEACRNLSSVANGDTFRTWYRDDAKYNKRVGVQLSLNRKSENIYEYDSINEPTKRFHPLNSFLVNEPEAVFPLSIGQETLPIKANGGGGGDSNKYWFTSEAHTFFQFSPGQRLEFQGDDDFFAFIDGKLVVDLGGMHQAYRSYVDLNNVQADFGLIEGRVYSLDLFHAERRMSESNFKMTTNLARGCTILRVGKSAFAFNAQSAAMDWQLELKLLGASLSTSASSIVSGVASSSKTTLVLPAMTATTGSVGYAFHKLKQNVGRGFVSEFSFRLDDSYAEYQNQAEGISFIIHRDPNGLSNPNGGSGGNLGIKNFRNAVAVVFDTCADRGVACKTQSAKVHTAYRGAKITLTNAVREESITYRFVRIGNATEKINQAKKIHRARIVYYGKSPNWLEVYLDDSLLVVLRDFDVKTELGGEDVWMGLIATTGESTNKTAKFFVSEWKTTTVAIDPSKSTVFGLVAESSTKTLLADSNDLTPTPPSPLPTSQSARIKADGKSSALFRIQTRDGCYKMIDYGGFGKWATGFLIERPRVVVHDNRRRALQIDETITTGCGQSNFTNYWCGDDAPSIVPAAEVLDRGDGTYDIVFKTAMPVQGRFDIIIQFGPCGTVGSDTANTECWNQTIPDAMEILPPGNPRGPNQELEPLEFPWIIVLIITCSLGGTACCLLCIALGLLSYRRRWIRSKKFIASGQLAVLDRDIVIDYDPMGNRLRETTNKLQQTHLEIHKLRSISEPANLDSELNALKKETESLKEGIKILKRKQQEDHGDQAVQTDRRSFASAMRTSRRNSFHQAAAAEDASLDPFDFTERDVVGRHQPVYAFEPAITPENQAPAVPAAQATKPTVITPYKLLPVVAFNPVVMTTMPMAFNSARPVHTSDAFQATARTPVAFRLPPTTHLKSSISAMATTPVAFELPLPTPPKSLISTMATTPVAFKLPLPTQASNSISAMSATSMNPARPPHPMVSFQQQSVAMAATPIAFRPVMSTTPMALNQQATTTTTRIAFKPPPPSFPKSAQQQPIQTNSTSSPGASLSVALAALAARKRADPFGDSCQVKLFIPEEEKSKR